MAYLKGWAPKEHLEIEPPSAPGAASVAASVPDPSVPDPFVPEPPVPAPLAPPGPEPAASAPVALEPTPPAPPDQGQTFRPRGAGRRPSRRSLSPDQRREQDRLRARGERASRTLQLLGLGFGVLIVIVLTVTR